MESLPIIGERFPSFVVNTTLGVKKIPEDYNGKWFILFSHPGDFTPVCTTEFIEFAVLADEFAKLNTELIGLSVDQVQPHIKWIEWINEKFKVKIPFPIIADTLGKVANSLGMISPYKGTNTVRAVFIVDDKGIIRVILYYPQEIGRNMMEILRIVKALQVADKYKVALPADWPNNRLIGNKVIIPPAASLQEAFQRIQNAEIENYSCYDWWFCFKSIF